MHFAPLIEFSWTFVMVAVTFVVLLLILRKFFFGKVRAFMQAREDKIKDAFDNADAAERIAEQRLREYDDKLAAVESERRDILLKARAQADENAKLIMKEAEAAAQTLRLKTERDIENEKAKAMADMRDQIAMLSIYAAEKILGRSITAEDQYEIVDGVIKEAEESTWKIRE